MPASKLLVQTCDNGLLQWLDKGNGRCLRQAIAFAFPPDRIGKVAVLSEAGNDVPMYMRRHVPQAGQVDLVGMHDVAHSLFDGKYNLHQVSTFSRLEITHFLDMAVQNDATESWIIRIINIYDSAQVVLPKCFSAR